MRKKGVLRDYHRKKIDNPFLKRKKEKRKSRKKIQKILTYMFFLSIMAGFFGFFSYSKFFDIKEVDINGASRVPVGEIEKKLRKQTLNKRFKIFSQDNIIFFDIQYFVTKIKEEYHFQNIKISKNIINNKITVDIVENKLFFVLKEGSSYYYVDSENYIVEKIDSIKSTSTADIDIPIIVNESNSLVEKNIILIKEDYIKRVVSFLKLFNSILNKEIIVSNFVIDDELKNLNNFDKNIIKISIKDGPLILFGDDEPMKEIKKLILIKNELGDDFYEKQYIDMSYGDKIFSK